MIYLLQVVTYKQIESSSNLYFPREEKPSFRRNRSSSEGAFHPVSKQSPIEPAGKLPDSSSTLAPPENKFVDSATYFSDRSSMLLNMVECIDFYDVGNVLGEIGILERKDNEIDAICETDVQVFFIDKLKLEVLMQKHPVLMERMWKILGVHIASTLLIKLAEYQVN